MSIQQITITDKIGESWQKYNETTDEIQVSGQMIPGNILEITKFDGNTVNIQLPYSEDKIINGLVTTVVGVGPQSTNTTPGAYQLSGVIYNVTATTTFPIPAPPGAPNKRIDIIYADNTSTLFYLAGTPGVIPVIPSNPFNTLVIAYIYVPNSGTPYIYTPNLGLNISPGSVIGSHLYQNGTAQVENPNFLYTAGTLLTNLGKDFSTSQDDGVTSYAAFFSKPILYLDQFSYANNNAVALTFQNQKFTLQSIDNVTSYRSTIKGNLGYLEIINDNLITLEQSKIKLDGVNQTLEIGVDNASLTFNGLLRIEVGGVRRQITPVNTATYTTNNKNHVLLCTTTNPITINLHNAPIGFELVIKDVNGLAGSNNITLNPFTGHTIDGASNYIISSNHQSVTIIKSTATNQSII